MYSYLKCIVYDKLLKPGQSFWITLYLLITSHLQEVKKLLNLMKRFLIGTLS